MIKNEDNPPSLGASLLESPYGKGFGIYQKLINIYKTKIVYRFFWGRSVIYRQFSYLLILVTTLAVAVSSFTFNILVKAENNTSFSSSTGITGTQDILDQGGSIETVLQADSTDNFRVIQYRIKEGDTYDSISKAFGIDVERIKLSNLDSIDYYATSTPVGETINIPSIDGLLVSVDKGDKLDTLLNKIIQGSREDIIEFNNLQSPDYKLPEGKYILVPDGLIKPPAKPIITPIYTSAPVYIPSPSPSEARYAGIQFVDPLGHPDCAGYTYTQRFKGYPAHNGVDLARWPGCPISAIAKGTVEFAGFTYNEGFMVRINHGNGVESLYFHGDGQMWVRPGEYVEAGTPIMNMGTTGISTGVHLHLSVRYYGDWIDPAPFVPYNRN